MCIITEFTVNVLKLNSNDKRISDLLKENLGIIEIKLERKHKHWIVPYSLGSLPDHYFLTSDRYVSKRIIAEINKITSSMMENGFYTFYESFGAFVLSLRGKNSSKEDSEEFLPLTLHHMTAPLQIMANKVAFAIFALLAERIISRFRQRRNQLRIQPSTV